VAIIVNSETKVIVQNITGREGEFHTRQMIEYGTKVVAGVTPGKGGREHLGVPVYDTMAEAVALTGADASAIFVPAPSAADAILEAEDAGVRTIVCITDGIPTSDMVHVCARLREHGHSRLIGPNCPGILTAGECKIGIMPGHIFKNGPVGVVSRSGTLTYEIAWDLTRADLGQTTAIGIGGDPVLGSRFVDVLPLFEADPETKVVVLVGEIGGTDEEMAAEYIKSMTKPVVGFISGRTAPPGKRMGHAGAIISGGMGGADSKLAALSSAGVAVAETTADIPSLVRSYLKA